MTTPSAAQVALVDPDEAKRLAAAPGILALIGFGGPRSAGDGRSAWIETGLEVLQPPPVQTWRVSAPVEYGRLGAFTARTTPGLAMLAIALPDTEDPETTAAELYGELIETSRWLACPNLIRIWQYLPRITETLGREDRYRAWCAGRARAFEAAGAGDNTRLPSACLLGDSGDRILLYALVSASPGRQIENPRQQSAFRYPPRFGRRSPSFSRATAFASDDGTTLYISGTSSITGHASRHRETLDQLDETLANLEALMRHWGGAEGLTAIAPMKVYLRHRYDLDPVRAALAKRLPRDHPIVYLRADVCRAELNVEIEGLATAGQNEGRERQPPPR